MRARVLFAVVVCGVACGRSTQQPLSTTPDASSGEAPTSSSSPNGAEEGTSVARAAEVGEPSRPALAPEHEKVREQAIDLLDRGKFADARAVFEALLRSYPQDASLLAFRDLAAQREADERARAMALLDGHEPIVLPEPPWRHTVRTRVETPQRARLPKLPLVSSERNAVTDDDTWFAENDLRLPLWDVSNGYPGALGPPPSHIPKMFGGFPLQHAINHPDHSILIYGSDSAGGSLVAVLDKEHAVLGIFDFAEYVRAPKVRRGDERFVEQAVRWAQVQDGVLYVSHGHRTYAASSGGMNAYVTALDLETGELLWRSAPKVSGTLNFLLHEGWIITGYGFTAEPDHLVVLDQRNGKVAKKIKLKTGPDFVLRKGDELFVRTYDTNYVFGF